MFGKFRKSIIMILVLCLFSSISISGAFASTDKDSVTILKDNAEVRIVNVVVDGETASATFWKKSGDIEIKANGKTQKISGKKIQFAQKQYQENIASTKQPSQIAAKSSNFKLKSSESIHLMGYKKYWDSSKSKNYWKLDGPGYFNSKSVYEDSSNDDALYDFKTYIDKSAEYWTSTKGALIGAGAAAIVGTVLALLPEPVASKAAATAALVAAGASASAALAAGGYYYSSNKYYNKAKEAYDRI